VGEGEAEVAEWRHLKQFGERAWGGVSDGRGISHAFLGCIANKTTNLDKNSRRQLMKGSRGPEPGKNERKKRRSGKKRRTNNQKKRDHSEGLSTVYINQLVTKARKGATKARESAGEPVLTNVTSYETKVPGVFQLVGTLKVRAGAR